MQASDTLAGKREGFSRFGGQGLRHKRVENVVGRPENKSRHPAQIQSKL